MDPALLTLGVLVATLVLLVLYVVERRRHAETRAALARTEHGKRSQSTRYGQATEQYAPFLARWPFPSTERFRFLGDPVDGVHFDADAVYFVEIKTGRSQLKPSQRAVRDAVAAGRVGWVEFRADDARPAEVLRPWLR